MKIPLKGILTSLIISALGSPLAQATDPACSQLFAAEKSEFFSTNPWKRRVMTALGFVVVNAPILTLLAEGGAGTRGGGGVGEANVTSAAMSARLVLENLARSPEGLYPEIADVRGLITEVLAQLPRDLDPKKLIVFAEAKDNPALFSSDSGALSAITSSRGGVGSEIVISLENIAGANQGINCHESNQALGLVLEQLIVQTGKYRASSADPHALARRFARSLSGLSLHFPEQKLGVFKGAEITEAFRIPMLPSGTAVGDSTRKLLLIAETSPETFDLGAILAARRIYLFSQPGVSLQESVYGNIGLARLAKRGDQTVLEFSGEAEMRYIPEFHETLDFSVSIPLRFDSGAQRFVLDQSKLTEEMQRDPSRPSQLIRAVPR